MNFCPYCQKPVLVGDVKCKYCGGWFIEDAEQKQRAIDQGKQFDRTLGDRDQPVSAREGLRLFYIPEKKLIFVCLLSFGLYELYWFYRNWKAIRDHEQIRISPVWRSIFSVLFCYNFFKRIRKAATARGYSSSYSAGALALLYIVLTMLLKLPAPWDQLELLTFIPLVMINPAICYLNQSYDPAWVATHRFNKAEMVWIIVGMLFWLAMISDWLKGTR